MHPLELLLRATGVALLGTLTIILLRLPRRDLKSRVAAWLAASVGAFLITSMPDAEGVVGLAIYPLTALCSTHPVWFWLFSVTLFSDKPTLRIGHIVSLGIMAIAGVLYQSALPEGVDYADPVLHSLGVAFGAATLLFALLAPLTVSLGMRQDLDTRRRRIRRWLVPAVSMYLTTIVAIQGIVLARGEVTPKLLVIINIALIDGLAALALASFVRLRVVAWLDLSDANPAPALSRSEQRVLENLQRRFVTERLYAREALGIAQLATVLDTQEHILRRVINHGLGYKNFNDFLHAHRLKEAAQRLRDPAARRIPVLTIALEAGYGSIGPFNRAFKERFGLTPTEYRRAPTVDEEPFGATLSQESSSRGS